MSTRRHVIRRASRGLLGLGVLSAVGPVAPGLRIGTEDHARTGTGLVSDRRYLEHRLPDVGGRPHPERPLRLVRMLEEFRGRGLVSETADLSLHDDPMPHIRHHHEPHHVASIRRIETTGRVAELAVAGALGAVDAVAAGRVRNAFCAVRPPGHHANDTGAEEGFCFYSNAAIAARYARQVHGFERILIVDWDYHHGNATQNAFYRDPGVLFFSTHDRHAYPGTGDPSLRGEGPGEGLNINVHLDCGSRDADMLRQWERRLLPAVERFRPDFVLVSAGFDSRRDDLLGCFDLSDDAFRRMTRLTLDVADRHCEGRVVSLLEGGYNVDGTALAASAHLEVLLEGS